MFTIITPPGFRRDVVAIRILGTKGELSFNWEISSSFTGFLVTEDLHGKKKQIIKGRKIKMCKK